MRNRVTFCNLMGLLLFIGKLGHIGTLNQISWFTIISIIVLDTVLDYLESTLNLTSYLAIRVATWLKYRRVQRMLDKEAKKLSKKK